MPWTNPPDDSHVERAGIDVYHLDVLKAAVCDAQEFEVNTKELREALRFLEKRSTRSLGFRLFREGLIERDISKLHQGYEKICMHLGKST